MEDFTKDKLDIIFDMQKDLNGRIELEHNVFFSRDEWIQKEILAIISELNEVLGEVNYKWWKNPKVVNDAALKEEIVDVFHFFVSLCDKAGMDAKELYEIYIQKNKENHDRQSGLSRKSGYKA